MTFASLRNAAQHVAKRGVISPHELAALTWLDENLTDQQRQQFTELWRAAGSPASKPPAANADWLAPTMKIIKKFEGCHLNAYLCPAGVPTIGWGSTRMGDRSVQMGDKISQTRADQLLVDDVATRYQRLLELLPMMKEWPANRVAALVSWAYNVGMVAVADSTLRKRLLAGEEPVKVISEELPRWNKANGKPLAGLTRRRAAEVAMFVGQEIQQPAKPKAQSPHLILTRTKTRDSRGLELLRLVRIKNSLPMGELLVVSGAPGRQAFRTGAASESGSLEPLPEGHWYVDDIAWAGGKDNYNASYWLEVLLPIRIY